jgi:hypothetical protein
MEGHCSTGQSPQWAVVLMEEEEEEATTTFHPQHKFIKERSTVLCNINNFNIL